MEYAVPSCDVDQGRLSSALTINRSWTKQPALPASKHIQIFLDHLSWEIYP